MSEQQILLSPEVIRRARIDFEYFCAHFVRIVTRDGIQLFTFNRAQRRLWEVIRKQIEAGKPVRVIIVKARQMGMSTFVQAFLFWRSLTRPATGGMVIAHDEESTAELFDKILFMYEELEAISPEWFAQLEAIRDTKKKGKKIAWRGDLNTGITVQTAGNKRAGRGRTLKRVHMSECAFWEDPEKLVFGLTQSIGIQPDTDIIKESTANGIGNWFHRDYTRAKQGKSSYEAFFGAWFEEESYTIEPPPGFRLTNKEKAIKEKFKLTMGQMAWRRQIIEDDMEGDEDLFRQEYPATDEEAFLVTGRPYFGRKNVEFYQEMGRDPIKTGRIHYPHKGLPQFVEEEDGPWHIFVKPQPNRPYAISGDVAGGTSADYSFAVVLDLLTLETAATYMDKIDPDEFAYELQLFSRTYNRALIAPEKNGEGRATLLKLLKNMTARVFYHIDEDEWDGGVVTNYGWRTSSKTRPVMLAQTAALIRKRELKIYCRRILSQMASFVRVDSSKIAEGQSGSNDDGVMALCIACSDEVRQQAAYVIDDD